MTNLVVESLQVVFDGRTILDIPQLELEQGKLLVISGPSGSGKSTLLNVICGLLEPDAGQVSWNYEPLFTLNESQRANWRAVNCGFMFQDFHLLPALSVLDNVLMPIFFRAVKVDAEQRQKAIAQLRAFGLSNLHQRCISLSRGEQQRVAMARALFENKNILLADEPTASLDRENAEFVINELKQQAAQGRFVLIVSHDPLVQSVADKHFILTRGKLQ
jgi:putative ABC transport system ATP-binding protein